MWRYLADPSNATVRNLILHNLPLLALLGFLLAMAFASVTGILLEESELNETAYQCNMTEIRNSMKLQVQERCSLGTGEDVGKFKYENNVARPLNGTFNFKSVHWILHETGETGPQCDHIETMHGNISVFDEIERVKTTKTVFYAEALCASLCVREF